jgi:alkanesulfonate monooxygenase SsuD/methylene tetrahydromethanopterin reductase-like flavin-dependent oxidoreductase (luciferase family)
MDRKIRAGLGLATFPFDAPRELFAFAERCERWGVDSLWQTDRLQGSEGQLEALATMAALAGCTERIKFGMNAVVASLRDPLVLAKQCATIDFLSRGRLLPVFGVGVDADPVWKATGRDPRERGRRADEALAIAQALWRGEEVHREGRFFRYAGARIAPLPVQQPLPCWIGGSSPAAIRRTAQLGTGWLGGLAPPEEVARVIAAIRAELAAAGRTIDADHYGATLPCRVGAPDAALGERIGRARAGLVVTGSPGEIVARARAYLSAGASKLVLIPLARGTRDFSDQAERLVDEVIPAIQAGPAGVPAAIREGDGKHKE